jgi:hypothetical protein
MASGIIEQQPLSDEMVQKNLPSGVSLVRTLRGHKGWVDRIAWSPDGKFLASASEDRTIRLWEAETGNLVDIFEGHEDWVYAVAWSNDGQKIISTSADSTIRIWKTKKRPGEIPEVLIGHNNSVFAISRHPDGQLIASGSRDGTVIIWMQKDESWKISWILKYNHWVNSLSFSPDGRYLASGTGEGVIHICDVKKTESPRVLRGHSSHVVCVSWSPDGKTIASASSDNTIRIWDAKSGEEIRALLGHNDPVRYVCYSSGGEVLASRSNDGTIRIWRSSDWETISIIQEPCASRRENTQIFFRDDLISNWLSGLAFHPNLPLLAAVGSDPDGPEKEREKIIHIYELDLAVLLGNSQDYSKKTHEVHKHIHTPKIEVAGTLLDQQNGEFPIGYSMKHPEKSELTHLIPHEKPGPSETNIVRTKVFISYSRKDEKIFNEFKIMLAPAIQKGLLELWDDTKIKPGTNWRDEIKAGIAAAKVAVLLVSPDFLASDFIVKNELPPLLKAAQDDGVTIFWVCLGACLYKNTEINKYQAAHNIERPLYKLNKPERMEALANICSRLLQIASNS